MQDDTCIKEEGGLRELFQDEGEREEEERGMIMGWTNERDRIGVMEN